MQSVGIIGSGMAGMAAAWKLRHDFEVTLLEKEPRYGGHTHTVEVARPEETVAVDTGFMVFNHVTYPGLVELFAELDVPTMPTDMSFGVHHSGLGLEYCGAGLNALFAQRKNLVSPRFWQLLRDIIRFNKLANAALDNPQLLGKSLADFVDDHNLSLIFRDAYLVPMTAAIWSTPPDRMLQFPAATLLRFMANHGLLGVKTQHQWWTVKGGSREYRDRLLRKVGGEKRTAFHTVAVREKESGVDVICREGEKLSFDHVVIATHADEALRLLYQPNTEQKRLLQPFQYANNPVALHSDESVMPESKSAWASWNYRMDPVGKELSASTHYWMNRLQGVSERENYFVSVDYDGEIRPDKTFFNTIYTHPMFDEATARAQLELPSLNESGRVYFCGSYFRYGFHEDALMSGYNAAGSLLRNQQRKHEKLFV